MFIHHDSGIKQIKRSPHLPCGLIDVISLGLNFKVLNLKTRSKISKYSDHIKANQNHHQYCHKDKCIKISDEVLENPTLKLV
jgi:hypothetical protein